MAELTPPGYDNMACISTLFYMCPVVIQSPVFWLVRTFESCIVDDRTYRDSSHHRQVRQQLEGFPVPVRSLLQRIPDNLVWYRRQEGQERRSRLGQSLPRQRWK
jgi:hypothetical protein